MSAVDIARRQRLWFNGQKSSELEVVPSYVARRGRHPAPVLHLVQPEEPLCDADLEDLIPTIHNNIRYVFEPAIFDPNEIPPITLRRIVRAVCEFYGVSLLDIVSDRRIHRVVFARQVAYYLCATLTKRSLGHIGKQFGHRDHSTIWHGMRKIAGKMADDVLFAAEVNGIRASLMTFPVAVPICGGWG